MHRLRRSVLPALFVLGLLPLPAGSQTAADPGLERLRLEIERLAPLSGGILGLGIIHLESGAEVFVNADEPFPMASTFKLPVAVGEITHLLNDPGVSLSVRNLMKLMLLISDNSAADILLRTAGGAPAVNARLARLGIAGISVDRTTVELIADAGGVKGLPPEGERTPTAFRELQRRVTDADRAAARVAFYQDAP